MPSSTTVPATPAPGGTTSPGTTPPVGIPDYKLLKVTQVQFTKHTSIDDLHQSLNATCGDMLVAIAQPKHAQACTHACMSH